MNTDLTTVALERTYDLPGGSVRFCSPAKRSVDILLQMADHLSREWGAGVVERAARTMRLRMYIRRLEVGGFVRRFEPVDTMIDLARGDTENLMAVCENIRKSMDFMPESLYCALDQRAEQFRRELAGGKQDEDESVGQPGGQTDSSRGITLDNDFTPDQETMRRWVREQTQDREDE